MSMVTKFVRVVTYHEELTPISSHEPSMKWSCVLTLQIKDIISTFAEDPWTPN